MLPRKTMRKALLCGYVCSVVVSALQHQHKKAVLQNLADRCCCCGDIRPPSDESEIVRTVAPDRATSLGPIVTPDLAANPAAAASAANASEADWEKVRWVHTQLNSFENSEGGDVTPLSRIRDDDDTEFAAQLVFGGAEKWIQNLVRDGYPKSVSTGIPIRPDQDHGVEAFTKTLFKTDDWTDAEVPLVSFSDLVHDITASIDDRDECRFQPLLYHLDEVYVSAANPDNAELWSECLKGHPLTPTPDPQEISYANLHELTSDMNTTLHSCLFCSEGFVSPASLRSEDDPKAEVRIVGHCQCGEEIALDKRDGEKATSKKLSRHYHLGCLQDWYHRKQECPHCKIKFARHEVVQVVNPERRIRCSCSCC